MKRDNRGVSLVEVLVAMAILAICVLPLFKSLVTAVQVNVKSRIQLSATTAAESVLEEMKSDGMEHFLEENSGNSKISDIETITKEGKAVGYTFTYPNYQIDGKSMKVKVEARPYVNTQEDENYNDKEVADLYRMNLETDGIYVQNEKTAEADFLKLASEGVYEISQKDTVLSQLDVTWDYEITGNSEFQNVEQTVTYRHGTQTLGEHTTVLYNNGQKNDKLKSLYICFIPNQASTINLINKSNYPVTVYLIKQGEQAAKNVTVNLYGDLKEPGTTLRTNLKKGDLVTYYQYSANSHRTLTDTELKENYQIKNLEGSSVWTRLYDIDISVEYQDKEQAALSGTVSR